MRNVDHSHVKSGEHNPPSCEQERMKLSVRNSAAITFYELHFTICQRVRCLPAMFHHPCCRHLRPPSGPRAIGENHSTEKAHSYHIIFLTPPRNGPNPCQHCGPYIAKRFSSSSSPVHSKPNSMLTSPAIWKRLAPLRRPSWKICLLVFSRHMENSRPPLLRSPCSLHMTQAV